jgi:hypothetical protein
VDEHTKILRLWDRSRTTTDWQCQRRRWWNYEYDGRGIVSDRPYTYLEFFMGTVIHDAMAAIAWMTKGDQSGHLTIDEIAQTAHDEVLQALLPETAGEIDERNFAQEQAALIEGIVRGFYRYMWPRLLAQYPKILLIEGELLFPHNGLGFMSKPDLVLATEDGSTVVYVEYKSTSSKKEDWINSWNTAVQLHSTIKAIEVDKGIKVDQVIVQGLYKGYVSYNKQNSPFCYAYKKNGKPPFSQDVVLYEYKAGFQRYPVWEMDGGVKKWVEEMPEQVLAENFPQTPPILIDESMVDSFFEQRTMREQQIKTAVDIDRLVDDPVQHQAMLNIFFPQNFSECVPAWGKGCPYRQLCFGDSSDPLGHGYTYRTPHHEAEAQQWAQTTQDETIKMSDTSLSPIE